MKSTRLRTFVGLLTVCLVALVSAHAQGEKIKVKGLITGRTGDTLVLKTTDGNSVTVTLDDDTKVQQPKGLGVRKTQMSAAVLMARARMRGSQHPSVRVKATTVSRCVNAQECCGEWR